MKIKRAVDVAKNLPLQTDVPLEFKLDSASDVITLDRLRIVERLRGCLGKDEQQIADDLEKEIREAGRP